MVTFVEEPYRGLSVEEPEHETHAVWRAAGRDYV